MSNKPPKNYYNPFLPPDCQDEPFSDPFGDGSIERDCLLGLNEDGSVPDEPSEEEPDEDVFTTVYEDSCPSCWTAGSSTGRPVTACAKSAWIIQSID